MDGLQVPQHQGRRWRRLGLVEQSRQPRWQRIPGQIRDPGHHRDDLRVGEARFGGGRPPQSGEGIAVAGVHPEGGAIERPVPLHQCQEVRVDGLVLDRMHEVVGARPERGLRGLEFGGVDRERHAGLVGGSGDGGDDRFLGGQVRARPMDEPDLDVVGLARQQPRHQRQCLFDRIGLDDRRVVELELRVGDHRDQGSRHRDPRRHRRSRGSGPDVEVPEWPADVDDRGDPACDPHLEGGRQAGLVACDLLRIGHDGGEVHGVRTRVNVARLEEVDVAVDEAGNDPFAGRVEQPRAGGHADRRRRPDAQDSVAVDDDRRIGLERVAGRALGVHNGSVDDREVAR